MKHFFFILILYIGIIQTAFSQKEANVWYFGDYAGLDFNTGEPYVLNGMFHCWGSGASISDSSGNFLFATNGVKIWNRNKEIMLNGDNIKGNFIASQAELIVPKPGSDNLYYVFTVAYSNGNSWDYGLYYSVIDMNLDGGLGGVTNEKNILLTDAYDAEEYIVGVRKENSEDIWIITRKFYEDGYAAFLLTSSGINTSAVFSPAIDRIPIHEAGNMKISHDKKRLATAYRTELGGNEKPDVEICNFNASTGEVNLLYVLRNVREDGCWLYEPWGVEFSPDSKWLYVSYFSECGDFIPVLLYQYDMQYYEDSAQFVDSKILVGQGPAIGLQLATDGKIYTTSPDYGFYDYVSVINNPWKRGTACNFEEDAIDLGSGMVGGFLPNILLDYLFRFEWEGSCSAEPFVFQPNFQPEPVYIRWSFSDPAAGADSISFDLNPVHYFTHSGKFEVKVVVHYPSGRVERTSRVVTVIESPHPDLGPDTLKCEMGDIVLNAGDEEGVYVWSDGTFGHNANEITVSDTGWYWVQVKNGEGCSVRDSIYVGIYPKAVIDESNLSLIPTSCGGSNGKILGLAVTGEEPLSFEWYDAGDNLVGTDIDLVNFPVGNYYLHILDANGCLTISEAYTIEDAGDIEIAAVEKQDAHCGQNTGSINITALSGNPSTLLYSIDNGASWQAGNPLFENLPAGNYFIRVKDLSDCETVFANNPLNIENIAGPEVNSVNTSPEIDYLQNGQIDISANANSGQLYYSIDNGASFQTDNGLFPNLSAGTYLCVIKDDFGCDTTFTAEVTRSISQLIDAIAGNGNTCIGNAAVVPLKLNNFTDIFKFHVKLTYDTAVLSCDGYINVNPALEAHLQASIIPGTNEVIVSWQGEAPTSLEENATMLELVFGAKKQGVSGLDWAALPGESSFYNESLDEVSADYHVGTLRVYTRPEIDMVEDRKVCEGERIIILPYIEGGAGDISYFWQGPDGFEDTGVMIDLQNTTAQQAGIYNLTVTDTIGCEESKTVNLFVNPSPQIAFSGQDTILAQSGFILEAGSGYESYLWNTTETSEAISISQEGDYWVEVSSAQQCLSADTVSILWGGEPFYLPNAFSPDGDGLNDEFKPVEKYDFVKTYQLSIFNRWGQLIFETSDISQGWDGSYQGNPVEQGSYVYKIVFTAYPDYSKKQIKTGNVVVVR